MTVGVSVANWIDYRPALSGALRESCRLLLRSCEALPRTIGLKVGFDRRLKRFSIRFPGLNSQIFADRGKKPTDSWSSRWPRGSPQAVGVSSESMRGWLHDYWGTIGNSITFSHTSAAPLRTLRPRFVPASQPHCDLASRERHYAPENPTRLRGRSAAQYAPDPDSSDFPRRLGCQNSDVRQTLLRSIMELSGLFLPQNPFRSPVQVKRKVSKLTISIFCGHPRGVLYSFAACVAPSLKRTF
jgi:hypothetical protein